MVGTAVADYFRHKGHGIMRICRPESGVAFDDKTVFWDVRANEIDAPKLAGQDVIIHLAGANIAGRRWSKEYKQEILNSRVEGTKLLCATAANYHYLPKVIVSASAVGFYGMHDPSVSLNESSPSGEDFLADVCNKWEKATEPAEQAGIRVVHLRLGVVLSPKGGALAKMLPPFQFGLGGPVGPGTQIMSWVALDEIPSIIEHIIQTQSIAGPVNAVAPNPVSNENFTKTLGRVLRRPAALPMPALAVQLLFGEMGTTLLLGGQRVLPQKLEESGYSFQYPELESALNTILH